MNISSNTFGFFVSFVYKLDLKSLNVKNTLLCISLVNYIFCSVTSIWNATSYKTFISCSINGKMRVTSSRALWPHLRGIHHPELPWTTNADFQVMFRMESPFQSSSQEPFLLQCFYTKRNFVLEV